MSDAEREQAIQKIIDMSKTVRQVPWWLLLEAEPVVKAISAAPKWEILDPMRVYIQQDAKGIKRVVEVAEDGQLIKHERPEVGA